MERIEVVGIDSKGYGRIYKLVLRDRQLELGAKAIYAYFCAYAGNGTTAFPKREKILRDLQMNKDTYTKYLAVLVDGGFISKRRTVTGNTYSIHMELPTVSNEQREPSDTTDRLVMRGVKSQGFGTIPKLAMLDFRLSWQAKAIYAYFCSFAGAGSVAFPSKATIIQDLGISARSYYTHLKTLISTGYLSVEQCKTGGRFHVSNYYLNDSVPAGDSGSGEAKKHDRRRKKAMSENLQREPQKPKRHALSEKLQCGKKICSRMSEKGMSQKGMSENLPCNINNKSNIINSFQNINRSVRLTGNEDRRKQIQEQIEYIYFQHQMPDKLPVVDIIVQYLTEFWQQPIRFNKHSPPIQCSPSLLTGVSSCTVLEFLEHIVGKPVQGIKKPYQYFRSAFYQFLIEQTLVLQTVFL